MEKKKLRGYSNRWGIKTKHLMGANDKQWYDPTTNKLMQWGTLPFLENHKGKKVHIFIISSLTKTYSYKVSFDYACMLARKNAP